MKGPCSCAIPRANGQSGFHPPCAGLTAHPCPARHSPSYRFWFLIEVRAGPGRGLHSCAFCGAGGTASHRRIAAFAASLALVVAWAFLAVVLPVWGK